MPAGRHNNGMHPTRKSAALKFNGSSGRVMPGVMPLRRADRQRGYLFEARAVMLKSLNGRKRVDVC